MFLLSEFINDPSVDILSNVKDILIYSFVKGLI